MHLIVKLPARYNYDAKFELQCNVLDNIMPYEAMD